MTRPPLRRRGATLMLVLWLIVLTGGIAAAVTSATRDATASADVASARMAARYAAESGVEAAAFALTRALESAEGDATRRRAVLARLSDVLTTALGDSLVLGETRAQVTAVDVNARLDLNAADTTALLRLLSAFGNAATARQTVQALRAHIAGDGRMARPLRSLDAATRVPGVDAELLARAAGELTVDSDGQVNAASASPLVLAAATGGRIDAPTRVLFIARGWRVGHPLTHEVQAVYAIDGSRLTFVRMRERDR